MIYCFSTHLTLTPPIHHKNTSFLKLSIVKTLPIAAVQTKNATLGGTWLPNTFPWGFVNGHGFYFVLAPSFKGLNPNMHVDHCISV